MVRFSHCRWSSPRGSTLRNTLVRVRVSEGIIRERPDRRILAPTHRDRRTHGEGGRIKVRFGERHNLPQHIRQSLLRTVGRESGGKAEDGDEAGLRRLERIGRWIARRGDGRRRDAAGIRCRDEDGGDEGGLRFVRGHTPDGRGGIRHHVPLGIGKSGDRRED